MPGQKHVTEYPTSYMQRARGTVASVVIRQSEKFH